MRTLVVYDIPDDKIRHRISEACKDYGLERIQWSAFLGDLNHNRRGELVLRLKAVLGRAQGSVHLYPICDKDMGLRVEVGRRAQAPEARKGGRVAREAGRGARDPGRGGYA